MTGAPRSAPQASHGPRAPHAPRARLSLVLLLLACAGPHLLRMALPVTTVADSFYPHAAWMLQQGFTPYIQFTQVAFPLAEGVLAAAFALCGHDLRVVELCNLLVVLGVAATLAAAAQRMVRRARTAATETAATNAAATNAAATEAAATNAAATNAAATNAAANEAAATNAVATEAAARRAGIVAALAWSWCAWVVHFNLFERETWAASGTALALLALFAPALPSEPEGRPGWRRATAIGASMALAFCIKITALMPAGALLVYLALTGRLREAARTAAVFGALIGAATLACWWAWGTPFLQQVYLFGFFRNPNVSGTVEALGHVAGFTDPLLALMFAALLAFGLPALRRPAGAPALMLLAELLFLTVISPTVWSHNLIGLAVPGALLLGGVAAAWSAALAWRMTAALALVLAAVLALPDTYMPDMTASPRALAPYVEGWSRVGIAHTAAFLQRHTTADEVVCTLQPAASVQAGRVEFLRYLDLQSLALALQAAVHEDGLRATWAARRGSLLLGRAGPPLAGGIAPDDARLEAFGPYVGRLLACGLAHDRPLLLDAVAKHEIGLFVEPLPPLMVTADELRAAGYERFEDHELGLAGWKPPAASGTLVVRDLYTR